MNGDWPAFPQPREDASLMDEGITIRDYFAAQACIGYLATWTDSAVQPGHVASMAYKIADAMLKAREK